MSARNSVYTPGFALACPNCNENGIWGFTIDSGAQCAETLVLGETLPWDPQEKRDMSLGPDPEPEGKWSTAGLGACQKCNKYISGMVLFDGLTYVGIGKVWIPAPDEL